MSSAVSSSSTLITQRCLFSLQCSVTSSTIILIAFWHKFNRSAVNFAMNRLACLYPWIRLVQVELTAAPVPYITQ